MLIFKGSSDIKKNLKNYFESLGGLRGKTIVDIPTGSGYMSNVLRGEGANVYAYDLFPEFFEIDNMECKRADLSKKLPIEDGFADIALFQEGIEHLADQFFAFKELNRILKLKGKLILTTPSISNLRAKVGNLLMESDMCNRSSANELDAVWFSDEGRLYFGHVFLVGIQRIRVLAKLAGFKIKKIHAVKVSPSSLFFGIVFPVIFLFNLYAYLISFRKNKNVDSSLRKATSMEIFRLNIHPSILFGKHLFIEFEKEVELDSVALECSKDGKGIF